MKILITGANRGIGAALSDELAQRGHEVLRAARSGSGYLPLDVTDPSAFQRLSDQLAGAPLDAVVCNAGVYQDKGHALETGYPAQMWADSFAVNVTGVFLTIQTLLPNLRLSQAPRIAIISSQMASQTRAPGGSYIYRASKAAALNLGRNLAADLQADGIAVGTYHPGWVQTDMGGSAADITVDDSAMGLADRVTGLTLDNTGCFETWDGRPHPY